MVVSNGAKRRRLSPVNESSTSARKEFYRQAATWELEQDYERLPRKKTKAAKEKKRLPIKTQQGVLEQLEESDISEGESDNDGVVSDEESNVSLLGKPDNSTDGESTPSIPPKVQILQAKEELAKIATRLNEDPEENVDLLKKLTDMNTTASLLIVKKLVLASQATIYKDIIPGYKIRPLNSDESSAKVSKEVRRVRSFEQSLLSGYRAYVQQLASHSIVKRALSKDKEELRSLAVKCACSLLSSVPHFNFRGELLKILVGQVATRRVDDEFLKSLDTLEEMFDQDDDGTVSMEAVSLLSKMIKTKEFRVRPAVLDTFLHLRLLSEFSSKGSKDSIDKDQAEESIKGKKQKQKREFRTKKTRKLLKERKAVEKDMMEADALVSHEHRDKMQAETLKMVFTAYFRILKTRNPELVGAVLEGLAKFAHLINQDFFGDLLEVLRDLLSNTSGEGSKSAANGSGADAMAESEDEDDIINGVAGSYNSQTRNATRDSLLCSTTAFALLDGQDGSKAASSLHLDLGFFISHLYQSLYSLSTNPDIEFHPDKSLRLPEPQTDGNGNDSNAVDKVKHSKKVDFQTPTVLMIRCLQPILTAKANKAPPPIRIAGFTKRLMTCALQLPEKSALAILSLLSQVTKLHGRKITPLWHTEERKGDGVFDPAATDVERSNVFAGTVWEGELLRLHYCPQVRDAARAIEKGINKIS